METPSAFDRVQTRADDPSEPFAWKPLVLVVLVAVGLAGAYAVFSDDAPAGDDDLLARLIGAATAFRADVGTTRPTEAEAFVSDALGWAVTPPDLPGLALVGAQIAPVGDVADGGRDAVPVVIPAYRYEGRAGESAVVFAYDYLVLDQVRETFDLPEATYAVLGEPTPVDTRRLDDAYLVTWRRRAMIFTAVTRSEAVFERIGQAASS